MPIATILAILNAAVTLLPELAQAVPVIEKMLNGQAVEKADLEALDETIVLLNKQVAGLV